MFEEKGEHGHSPERKKNAQLKKEGKKAHEGEKGEGQVRKGHWGKERYPGPQIPPRKAEWSYKKIGSSQKSPR